MIVSVTLKDPDGFYDCVSDSVKNSLDEIEGLTDSERKILFEERMKYVWNKLSKFVEHQEYIFIEFDTEKETAKVVEVV